MNQNNIVILGSSGFIGSHLEIYLKNLSFGKIFGFSSAECDLTNIDSTKKISKYLSKDTSLIILAAQKRQFGDSLCVLNKNLLIVKNICELLYINPVKQIIFISSAAVYGEETENTSISEDTKINPTSYYGIYKYSAERIIKKLCIDRGIDSWIFLRPPLVYGPGDKAQTYGPTGFTNAVYNNNPIIMWGDGSELREFIYIDDLSELIGKLIFKDFKGEINVISGTSYSFKEIIDILLNFYPNMQVLNKPRTKQKANNAFISGKIPLVLGTKFEFTPLESGIEQILSSYKSKL